MSTDPLGNLKQRTDTLKLWMNRATFILMLLCVTLTGVYFISVERWLHGLVCFLVVGILTYVAHKVRERGARA